MLVAQAWRNLCSTFTFIFSLSIGIQIKSFKLLEFQTADGVGPIRAAKSAMSFIHLLFTLFCRYLYFCPGRRALLQRLPSQVD